MTDCIESPPQLLRERERENKLKEQKINLQEKV